MTQSLNNKWSNNPLHWHIGGSLAVLAMVGAGWAMGVAPMFDRWDSQTQLLTDKKQLSNDIQTWQSKNQALQAQLNKLQEQHANTPMLTHHLGEQNQRLDQLLSTFQTHDGRLASLETRPAVDVGPCLKVPLVLKGSMPQADWVGFLDTLHEQDPDLRVDAFELKRPEDDNGRLGIQLTLSWHVQPKA